MSVEYSANTVFGIKAPLSAVLRATTSSGCQHVVPTGQKFCGECGKPAAIQEYEFTLDCWDKGQDLSFFKPGYNIDMRDLNQEIVVGFLIGTSDSPWDQVSAFAPIDVSDHARELMIDEIVDYFNNVCNTVIAPSKIGMYTVLHWS